MAGPNRVGGNPVPAWSYAPSVRPQAALTGQRLSNAQAGRLCLHAALTDTSESLMDSRLSRSGAQQEVGGRSCTEQTLRCALQALMNVHSLDPSVFSRALGLESLSEMDLDDDEHLDAETLLHVIGKVGPKLLRAAEDLWAEVESLDPDAILDVLRELGLEDDRVEITRDLMRSATGLQGVREELYASLKVALPATDIRKAVHDVANRRLKEFLRRRGISNTRARLGRMVAEEPWTSVWAHIRRQYPTGREAVMTSRSARRVLVIGPGFGLLAEPQMINTIQEAGYMVETLVHLPNPQDLTEDELDAEARELNRKIERLQPHVIVAASKGGKYLKHLWKLSEFRIPSLMINVHHLLHELPCGFPVVLTHGSRDKTFPRIQEHTSILLQNRDMLTKLLTNVHYVPLRKAGDTPGIVVMKSFNLTVTIPGSFSRRSSKKVVTVPRGAVLLQDVVLMSRENPRGRTQQGHMRVHDVRDLEEIRVPAKLFFRHGREELERLTQTGQPGGSFLYLSTSGLSFQEEKWIITRRGDDHAAPFSLLQDDLLPRLIDAVASGRPEEHIHESWWNLMPPARKEAEAFLGFDPNGLTRFWESKGRDCPRFAVAPGSEEFRAVEAIFRADPPDKIYRFEGDWAGARVLGVDRVESQGQQRGTDSYYGRVRSSLRQQGVEFVNGVHTRWLFHGSSAIDGIIQDAVSGFKPLLSQKAIWGSGVYFARDAQYPDDHGYIKERPDGVREVLLCLVVTGMSYLGDPTFQMLPYRSGMHRYNSFVDSLSNPEIYVTTVASAAVPTYVVQYE